MVVYGRPFNMGSILVFALALLLASSSVTQDAPTLGQIQEIATGNREDRFEQIVRFIERAKTDDEAKGGLAAFQKAAEILGKRETQMTPEERNASYEVMYRPLRPNIELLQMSSDDIGVQMARSLYSASRSERVAQIKKLAIAGSEDWPIKDDEAYFGPRCGTYDHTNELKIQWAARRYHDEAVEALSQPSWNGRRRLMLAMDEYGFAKLDPNLAGLLRRLSEDRNTLVRGQAILFLARYPGKETEHVIERALTNKAADTRAKALVAAATLKLKSVEGQAIRMTEDDAYDVSREAIDYLGVIGTPAAKARLIDIVVKEHKLWPTLDALEKCKAIEASPYLADLLSKDKTEDRGAILDTLAAIDADRAVEEIERAFKSSDNDFARSAVYLVGTMKLRSLRSQLLRLASHKDEGIRDAVIWALQELDKS